MLCGTLDDKEVQVVSTAVSGQEVVDRDHKQAVTFKALVTCSDLWRSFMLSSSEASSPLSFGCGALKFIFVDIWSNML